jgi:hypothetical protein
VGAPPAAIGIAATNAIGGAVVVAGWLLFMAVPWWWPDSLPENTKCKSDGADDYSADV